MGIIGIIICIVIGIIIIVALADRFLDGNKGLSTKGWIILLSVFILGVALIWYDCTSPIKVTKDIIITTKPEQYGIKIISKDTLFTIQCIEKVSTRPLTSFGDDKTYILIK